MKITCFYAHNIPVLIHWYGLTPFLIMVSCTYCFPLSFLNQKPRLLWNAVIEKLRISLRTDRTVGQCFRKLIFLSLIFPILKGELGQNLITLILIKEGTNFSNFHFITLVMESVMMTENLEVLSLLVHWKHISHH